MAGICGGGGEGVGGLMQPVTIGECEAWVGSHHRGFLPISGFWVDDGFGNAVSGNLGAYLYFMGYWGG